MLIVDSCGWLEWFSDGPLADQYRQYLSERDQLIVPSIVQYEVYKVLKREVGEEKALQAIGYMKGAQTVSFDDTLALAAADLALREKLAMADAIILATAYFYHCSLVSSDADLEGKPGVQFIPKTT